MAFLLTRRKKWLGVLSIIVMASAFAVLPVLRANAAAGGDISIYLQEIAQTTNGILTAITTNSNPAINFIIAALNNLTAPDTATNPQTPTPLLQTFFTTYTLNSANSLAAQNSLQPQMLSDFFGANINTQNLPYANDLVYSSLLGIPYFSPDPRSQNGGTVPDVAYNYFKYAAAININHILPGINWRGSVTDQARYTNYYNTVSAVQTFDGYVLSQLDTDIKNGVPAMQQILTNLVSNPKLWFATITTENIGAVYRQTLMFESQIYILMTQMLQIQKSLLAAEAMNNSLLIATGTNNETLLVSKAITSPPGT